MKRSSIKYFAGAFLASFSFTSGVAQYHYNYMNDQHQMLIEEQLFSKDYAEIKPIAFKPFLLEVEVQEEWIEGSTENWTRKSHSSLVMRKIRNEHLVQIEKEGFSLRANPVFNLQFGREQGVAGNIYTNTRGYDFRGNIGKHVFFASSLYESQSIFPSYVDSVVSGRQSVPGMGRWKPFKGNGYDYAFAGGYVGLAVNKNIHFQFGHDRHFLGYGHRSILLSDAAFNYPALRSTIGFLEGKLQLTSTWAVLQSLNRIAANYNGKEALMQRKGGTFHYLHFQPAEWLGLGIFEGTIWNMWDSVATPKPIPPAYFSPLPGLASLTSHGITSQLLGLNYFINPFNRMIFYGQLGLNRFSKSSSHQFGGKYLSAFGIDKLNILVEYNYIPAQFYGSRRSIDVNTKRGYTEPYFHNGQPLGLNSGDNREEVIFGISYRVRDFFAKVKYHQWSEAESGPGPFAASMIDASGGYIINPKSNMQLTGGVVLRESTHMPVETNYIYIAFRTNLLNTYFDF